MFPVKNNVVSLIKTNTSGQMCWPNILDTEIQDTGLAHLYWKRREECSGERGTDRGVMFCGRFLPTMLQEGFLEAIG